MIYRIGICDDEQLTCSELENYINEIFECKDDEAEIYVWNSGEALKKDISNGVKIDILFLDIELLDSNGIELGKYIRNYMKNMSMNIVYISSMTEYAMELFKIHPYDFVEIGKSYIINLKHMRECHVSYVVMDDGKELGISRAYRNYFNEKILEYNS